MSIVSAFLKTRKGKITGTLWFIMAWYIALALLTFHTTDASFSRASENTIKNILGVPGSYLADFLLQWFGIAACLLIVVSSVLSVRILFSSGLRLFKLRLLTAFLTLISLSALFAFLPSTENWPFYAGMGGMAGDLLYEYANTHLPAYGTFIIFSLIVMAGSWFSLAIRLAELRWAWKNFKKAVMFMQHWGYKASMWCINHFRKLLRKDPITVKEPEPEEEEWHEPVVEIKEKPVRKRAAEQQTLKLTNEFECPSLTLLQSADNRKKKETVNQTALSQNARLLESILKDFGVQGEIIKVRPGPVVTLYELEPAPGTKSSRVIGLADDIARSMSAVSARIAVVPGRNAIGIELPNATRETVYLRELLETEEYKDKRFNLPIALGKDIAGDPIIVDLARMPHLLVAGTTGSGKSVAINTMILSFLYRMNPDECKFIMIDPKMLELSIYEGIPHLLAPVVTEPGKAVVALKWTVKEMENRYRLMSHLGVRNVAGFNKRIEESLAKGEKLERTVQTGYDQETGKPISESMPIEMKKLPFIVVIVDEMADLMLTAGKDIESSIQRLAQMARAAGIHIIMATQRPSVDVITGVIKANFPTRISFQVTSRVDSRTILGEMGAEQLLGMGDMLYMSGGGRTIRVHGPFVDDKEVNAVVGYLKTQGNPSYVEDITREDGNPGEAMLQDSSGDSLYDQAVAIVLRDKKASTSYVQRQLKIGYNRAADLIDRMEQEGVISAPNHSGKREVIVEG